MTQQSKRVFIAINIPQAVSCLNEIKKRHFAQELRIVSETNIHLTLFFLGELPLNQVLWLQTELKSIQFTPFDLIGKGIKCFFQKKIANVMWLDFEESIALIQLHQQILEILKKMNPSLEVKLDMNNTNTFIPHCTLARSKTLSKNLALNELQTIQCSPIIENINSFLLMESHLHSDGARYQIIKQSNAQ